MTIPPATSEKPFQPGTAARVPKRLTRLRNTLTAGLIIIAPLAITIWVLRLLYRTADGFSAPLIRVLRRLLDNPEFHIPGLGFVITVGIIWIVGIVTTNVVGKRLVQNALKAFERLPVARTIYVPVRKLLETMTSPDQAGFKQVVLVEYPRKEMWTLGFLAGDVPRTDQATPAHSIFVCTAPNPTTGFMLIVTPEQMRPTNLTIEQAFQMIVSAGVVVPNTLFLPTTDWQKDSLDADDEPQPGKQTS